MALEATEFELSLEGLEGEAEAAERAPIRKPSSQPSFRPRPTGVSNPVTQMQLEAVTARLDGKMKTVSDSIGAISSRLASIAAITKKETVDRKKAEDSQGRDLNQKLQMLTLLPLLIQSPSKTLNAATALQDSTGANIPAVSVPDTNQLDALLPLLLVSGLGTSGPGGLNLGGDGSSGSDSNLMLLALVLAFARPKS
jgi:hypothetical protein